MWLVKNIMDHIRLFHQTGLQGKLLYTHYVYTDLFTIMASFRDWRY